jgi:hypothetical protein
MLLEATDVMSTSIKEKPSVGQEDFHKDLVKRLEHRNQERYFEEVEVFIVTSMPYNWCKRRDA